MAIDTNNVRRDANGELTELWRKLALSKVKSTIFNSAAIATGICIFFAVMICSNPHGRDITKIDVLTYQWSVHIGYLMFSTAMMTIGWHIMQRYEHFRAYLQARSLYRKLGNWIERHTRLQKMLTAGDIDADVAKIYVSEAERQVAATADAIHMLNVNLEVAELDLPSDIVVSNAPDTSDADEFIAEFEELLENSAPSTPAPVAEVTPEPARLKVVA